MRRGMKTFSISWRRLHTICTPWAVPLTASLHCSTFRGKLRVLLAPCAGRIWRALVGRVLIASLLAQIRCRITPALPHRAQTYFQAARCLQLLRKIFLSLISEHPRQTCNDASVRAPRCCFSLTFPRSALPIFQIFPCFNCASGALRAACGAASMLPQSLFVQHCIFCVSRDSLCTQLCLPSHSHPRASVAPLASIPAALIAASLPFCATAP